MFGRHFMKDEELFHIQEAKKLFQKLYDPEDLAGCRHSISLEWCVVAISMRGWVTSDRKKDETTMVCIAGMHKNITCML